MGAETTIESRRTEAEEFERILEMEEQRLSQREAALTLETKTRIALLQLEIERLQEKYPESQEKIKKLTQKITNLRRERLGGEAETERALAAGFRLEVKGFSEEIKKAAANPEVQRAIKELEQAEQRKDEAEIKRKRQELYEHTKELPYIDNEEVKIFLLRYLPGPFQKFFEAHCRIVYDPSVTSDTITPPTREGDKITFTFGPKALFGGLERIRADGELTPAIKPINLAFQIGRMLGTFLTEPSNWDKIAKQIEIDKGKNPSWEDFVALCLTSPQTARELSEPAYEHFVRCIQELSKLSEKEIAERAKEKREFGEVGKLMPRRKEGIFSKITSRFPLLANVNIFGILFKRLMAIYEEKKIWYDIAISQLEIEEAKLITTRQEHISDRDRRLWIYLMSGNRLGARGLILADANTGDSRWWRYHLYLAAFDPEYQRTKGEYISEESYHFLVRCVRQAAAARRNGIKPGEYVPIIEGGKKRYKRISTEVWDQAVIEEVDKLSLRMLLNTTEETFDYMKCAGRIMELDEIFGGDEPLAFSEGWVRGRNWEEEKYIFETNHFHRINIPPWLLERAFEASGPRFKLDPDQRAIIARILAEYELAESGGEVSRFVRNPIKGAEHARGIQRELVEFYQMRIGQYLEWKKRHPGQTNEAYERFIEMINHFKRAALAGFKRETATPSDRKILRDLGILDTEAERTQIDAFIQSEPNIKLHRRPEETASTYFKMRETRNQRLDEFREDLNKEDIPFRLKRWIIENPSRILDLLVHPDVTSQEVAMELLTEEDKDPAQHKEEFKQLTNDIRGKLIPVLQRLFRENKNQILALIRVDDWVRNNDLNPFLRRIAAEKPESLNEELSSLKKALEIFRDKVDVDATRGIRVAHLTDNERRQLEDLKSRCQILNDMIQKGELTQTSFYRDISEEYARTYLALKALEAAIVIKLKELEAQKKSQKGAETKPSTPSTEENSD